MIQSLADRVSIGAERASGAPDGHGLGMPRLAARSLRAHDHDHADSLLAMRWTIACTVAILAVTGDTAARWRKWERDYPNEDDSIAKLHLIRHSAGLLLLCLDIHASLAGLQVRFCTTIQR